MIELVIYGITGFVTCIIGYMIYKKEKINLIHGYHYKKVTEDNKKAYSVKIGKALLIIGFSMIFTGAINYFFNTSLGYIIFVLGFVYGTYLFIWTQKKYNGGIF